MNNATQPDPIFFMLLRAGQAQYARLEEALKTVGLSAAKYYVLSHLAKAGEPIPLRLLAEEQQCVPSNMTTMIDRLETEGLVRRIDDPSDRRSKRAALTPAGEERVAAGAEVVSRVQEDFASSLDATERLALSKILSSLS